MANITVNKQDAWRANKKRSLAKKFQKHKLSATRLQPLTNDEKRDH